MYNIKASVPAVINQSNTEFNYSIQYYIIKVGTDRR